jgi:hypothetical protein
MRIVVVHSLVTALVVAWLTWAGFTPARAQAQGRPAALAAAESALARRALDRAVELASSYANRHPDDPRGWMVLGKARLARSSGSAEHRLQAIWAFRKVLAAEPANLEAWDLTGRAAMLLGGLDGESIARDAFEHLVALASEDPDAWANWLTLYRGRGERGRMRRILERQDSVPEARARVARLLIEEERYDSANAVLDRLLRDDPFQPGYLALRAQSAFEAGDSATGDATYARALRAADRDDRGVLWSQLIGIASPAEIRAWEAGVPPALRAGFLTSFWARRNPDLFAGWNRRIAEHFARLREARKRFPLLHPLNAYQRNDTTRALDARASAAENLFYMMCEAQEFPGAPMSSEDRRRMPFPESGFWTRATGAQQDALGGAFPGELETIRLPPAIAPFAKGISDVDPTAAGAGYNLRTGLDDRGVAYLRFGAPARRVIGANNVEIGACRMSDLERWDYPGVGAVRFFLPRAVGGRVADMIFRPQNEAQFGGTVAALTRDATSVPAALPFGMWLAEFANPADARRTDLAVFATRSVVAAQLVAGWGEPGPPEFDSLALVTLTAPPGSYVLEVNARSGDSLGRLQRSVRLRDFSEGPQLSSLVLAQAWSDTSVDRRGVFARAQRDLVFGAASTIRAYAEVYGLPRTASGTVHYRASYELYPTSDLLRDVQRDSLPGGTRLDFDRERPAEGRVAAEWLDLTPELLPPGRYLLRLIVREAQGGRIVGRGQIGFEMR